MKKRTLFIFSLFLTITTYSQEATQSFTLQEAINYAIENNRTAKNASRDVEAAKQQKWETIATGLPQINANIEYQNWLKQQVSLFPPGFSDQYSQIRQLGSYYDLSSLPVIDNIPSASSDFTEVTFGTKQTINASVTLSQLIFDGSYIVGLQSAKVFLEISEFAKEKTDLEVRKAVINAYGNVLFVEEAVLILERNVSVLQKNLDETTKIYENGLEEEESVEQLQITLSGVESSLKNTTRLKELAYQMFNIAIGLDLNNSTILTENLENLTTKNIDLNLLDVGDDLENNIDYKIAANDKTSKELLLKLEKSRALPNLSAFVNAGYNGNNNSFDFLKNDQQWFGSSLFGISMNIPIISSGGRSAATQRARINLEKAQDDLTETEQKLKYQIATAKSEYQFAIEEFDNKKQNLGLAARIESKNQIKFFEGIASSFDLRQAQTQLYSAQNDYLQSMLDVISRKAELETVLNEIPQN